MAIKKYISLQTKVTKATNARFQECAKRAGLKSGYELLQVLVTAFLRVADPEHEPIAEEIEETELRTQWAEIFADWINASKRLNTAKPLRERDDRLTEAVMLFRMNGTKTYSVRRVMFRDGEPAFIGRDVDGAIAAILQRLRPDTAKALEEIGRACGVDMIKAIDELIDETNIPRVKDAGRATGLRMNEYGTVPVRHNNMQR